MELAKKALKESYEASWQLVIKPQRKQLDHSPCQMQTSLLEIIHDQVADLLSDERGPTNEILNITVIDG